VPVVVSILARAQPIIANKSKENNADFNRCHIFYRFYEEHESAISNFFSPLLLCGH